MYKIWDKFYQCDCSTEGIMTSFEMSEDEDTPVHMYLAFFNQGFDVRKLSFVSKLRFCWQILTTGKPYSDMVVLTKETASELGNDLLNFAKKN